MNDNDLARMERTYLMEMIDGPYLYSRAEWEQVSP